MRRANCRCIDLDEYVNNVANRGDRPPHADYALICGNRVVIVEDVDGKAELRDKEKVETSEYLLRGHGEVASTMRIYNVIHATKGADSMVAKVFRKYRIFLVTCCDKLRELISQ
ncbi:hypothetical protein JCM16161A_01480 [Vulcanisaeta sp. JCM 16161]|uniref:hypothetical protein n=1 Tax=Vulcanisaeta sp. JCM 16161 TaxID=1295372 RepID=UPI0006CF94F4|nr:hypothetical protein [Vulcanisaeta sp. JCM 16161]